MRASPDRETGDAPPILFRLAEKECAVHGGRKRRCCPNLTRFGVRFGDAFLSRVPRRFGAAAALGAGPGFAETSSCQPATNCHQVPGRRTDLTSSFPPLPLCPACGSASLRKHQLTAAPGERQRKEKQVHSMTTPKAPPTPRMRDGTPPVPQENRRTRHKLPLPAAPAATTPVFGRIFPVGKIPAAGGFFSTAAAATFLCQDKEKWGPHPPATGGCTI